MSSNGDPATNGGMINNLRTKMTLPHLDHNDKRCIELNSWGGGGVEYEEP
jgi:hypothetical protein